MGTPIPTGSLRSVCPYCGRATFRDTSDLRRHIRTHTGERPYRCTICPYSATRKEHLSAHLRRKHAPNEHQSNNDKPQDQQQKPLIETEAAVQHMQIEITPQQDMFTDHHTNDIKPDEATLAYISTTIGSQENLDNIVYSNPPMVAPQQTEIQYVAPTPLWPSEPNRSMSVDGLSSDTEETKNRQVMAASETHGTSSNLPDNQSHVAASTYYSINPQNEHE